MECVSLCGIPCLCGLSASAFIDSSLHQVDFFLEIFLKYFLLSWIVAIISLAIQVNCMTHY